MSKLNMTSSFDVNDGWWLMITAYRIILEKVKIEWHEAEIVYPERIKAGESKTLCEGQVAVVDETMEQDYIPPRYTGMAKLRGLRNAIIFWFIMGCQKASIPPTTVSWVVVCRNLEIWELSRQIKSQRRDMRVDADLFLHWIWIERWCVVMSSKC